MKFWLTTLLIAACATATCANAQNSSKNMPAECTAPTAFSANHLYGLWQAEIDGETGSASVRFQKDPEQDNSVVGSITRHGATSKPALLAGDVQHGDFQLEESDDGVRISATWSGQVVEGACGKEIRGLWTHALTDQSHRFVLRKPGGWQ